MPKTEAAPTRLHGLLLAVPAIMLAFAATAPAATVKHLNVKKLTNKSDAVVLGQILDITPAWDENGRLIESRVDLVVSEPLKGPFASGDLISFKSPGGTVGDTTVYIPGAERFSLDEEVVVFLRVGKKGKYRVVGLAQGKFSIRFDKKSKKKKARRDRSELNVVGAPSEEEEAEQDLEDFLEKIRGIARKNPGKGRTNPQEGQ